MVFTPTEDQVNDALDVIYYELSQLVCAYKEIPKNEILNNALLESTLVHVRNLIEFFKYQQRSDDNVLANHYGFYKPIEIESVQIDHLNKLLTHVTYSRIGIDKTWSKDEVIIPVLKRCKEFIDHILIRNSFGNISKNQWENLNKIIDKLITELVN